MVIMFTTIIEFLVFLMVTAGVFALGSAIARAWDQRRRLGAQSLAGQNSAVSLLQQEAKQNPFFEWVQTSTSISDSEQRQTLRRKLSLAGFDNSAAPVWYVIMRFGLAIGLPLAFLLSQSLLSKPAAGFGLIFWALLLVCQSGAYLLRKDS